MSSCAFPQLPFPRALRFEAEEWLVGKEERCHAQALDTKNFFTCKVIKSRGGQPLRSFLYCVPDNILSWRAVGVSHGMLSVDLQHPVIQLRRIASEKDKAHKTKSILSIKVSMTILSPDLLAAVEFAMETFDRTST